MNFEYQAVQIAITRADGGVSIMHYTTLGRGSILPKGAKWFSEPNGIWGRPAVKELIDDQITRAFSDREPPISYRILDKGEEEAD